jgi:ArsR family transcriptional regulator
MATTMISAALTIDEKKLDRASEILRALAHPIRIKIINFIDKNKSINVNKIYGTLKLEQSITSQHLRILRAADVVTTTRNGKYIIYSINYDKLNQYFTAIKGFLENKK